MANKKIMAILNVTPDSFSDGGKYFSTQAAVRRAWRLIKQGADIVDIGGESTRPGAPSVSLATELKRVIPVITALRKKTTIPISIDTSKPQVAAAAITAGATIINDVTGLRSSAMRRIAAQAHCPVILMHMQGVPRTMQHQPHYNDVITDISRFFKKQIILAKKSGIEPTNIILDPGIGFGKTVQHNLKIIARLNQFKQYFPHQQLLIGVSRKSFIGKITGQPVKQRLAGTLVINALALQQGADIIRVHDVAEHYHMMQILGYY